MQRDQLVAGCLVALQKLMVVGLLFGVAGVAAWWFEGRDKYADAGVPVPKPPLGHATPTPMVTKPENGSGLENLKYDLQRDVIQAGWVSAPTTARCDVSKISSQQRKFRCTVQYMGLQVPFQVDIIRIIGSPNIGVGLINYERHAERLPLTRAGVFAKFWQENTAAKNKNFRCDDIPEKTLVRPGRTDYFCYATTERNRHLRYAVEVKESGLRFMIASE